MGIATAICKGLTAELLRFYCDASGITLGKFVIQTRSVHSKSLGFAHI
jgi:hypothetical protein